MLTHSVTGSKFQPTGRIVCFSYQYAVNSIGNTTLKWQDNCLQHVDMDVLTNLFISSCIESLMMQSVAALCNNEG